MQLVFRSLAVLVLAFAPLAARANPDFKADAAHPRVSSQLEHLLSPNQRGDLERALSRMAARRATIDASFARYGVPQELTAIAIVESRFHDLPASANYLGCCAGVWQLNRITALAYGLRVDGKLDERRDFKKATEVVARHLADLRADFGDWPSAVLAYNIGGAKLRTLYAKAGTTNAWELLRRRKVGPFLGKVGAVTILMRDPIVVARES